MLTVELSGIDMAFEKDQFAAYMQLAQLGFDQWDRRRVYEWRVTLAIWAGVAGTITSSDVTFPIYAGMVLLLYHGLWLWRIWDANNHNKVFARFYLAKSQALMRDHNPPSFDKRKPPSWFLTDLGMVLPLIGTVLLICLVYLIKTCDKLSCF